MGAGRVSNSGVTVTTDTALEVMSVLACVRVLANGVCQVPFKLYQETNGVRRVATEHRLNRIVYRKPNPYQTAYVFREAMMARLALAGNCHVWIGRVGRNREIARLDIMPGRVETKFDLATGAKSYKWHRPDGMIVDMAADEVWHISGLSLDGVIGMDTLRYARDAIGLAVATEDAHAKMHEGGAQASGLLSVTDKLSAERFNQLSAWLDKHAQGGERQGKPLILDQGATFTRFNMTGVDAQHLETRRYQVEDICRAFGVMPIMIGHADKTATYASAEQMFLAHVVHTLSPLYERIEQSADINLLTEQEQNDGYYFKFTPNALMRGSSEARAKYYQTALGSLNSPGWMTPEEVRALEDMNPTPDMGTLLAPQPNASGGSQNA